MSSKAPALVLGEVAQPPSKEERRLSLTLHSAVLPWIPVLAICTLTPDAGLD